MALINDFGTCTSDFLGSAVDQCSINSYGDLKGIGLLRAGTKITEANFKLDTSWETLIKDSKYFPYLDVYNFEQTTPENEIATSSTGLKRIIRDGKPEYTLTFNGNPCTAKSLQNKKGLVWDIVLIFDKGILVKDNGDGTISGFQASYFDVGTLRLQQGTDIQSVSVMFQLDNSLDFNTRFGFVTTQAIGFDLTSLKGAFATDLQFTATAGTTLVVKPVAVCNSALSYAGLETASNWKVNGVAPSAVTYNASTGAYTLTVTSLTASSTVVVELAGEDTLGNIYTGGL